jgi:hypothetical protein
LLVINLYFFTKLTLCIMLEFELTFFSNFELFEFFKVRCIQGFEVENPSLINFNIQKLFFKKI